MTVHTPHHKIFNIYILNLYLCLCVGFNSVLYGVLFGMIAGMMVFITLKELLPTAHKYDTSDTIVTPFIFVGMAVMGGSLLLFEYTG
jgi:zinc transporter ZupT